MLIESVVPQRIGRDWIVRHIPHGGAMCLIDSVAAWDANRIQCLTRTHAHADNPLRAQNRLGALCGVEYAAQAAAIHGAILSARVGQRTDPARIMQGFLVALRDVESHVERLDKLPQELEIVATRIAALPGGASYTYVICHASDTVQTGRMTLKFAAAAADDSGADD